MSLANPYLLEIMYLVDDNATDNFVAQQMMRNYCFTKHLFIFEEAKDAIRAIEQALLARKEKELPQVILLDLEMPLYDGWDFLDDYTKLSPAFIRQCLLYVLSVSIIPAEVKKATEHPLVKAYLVKPLSAAVFHQIHQDFLNNRPTL